MKRTIAVDFDGTLCHFAFPNIGAPQAGAREALTAFRKLGYHVLIYSCRTCSWWPDVFSNPEEMAKPVLERQYAAEMITWLNDNKIPYDEVDDGTKGKPVADYYIDDKGVHYGGNWSRIQTQIELESLLAGMRNN